MFRVSPAFFGNSLMTKNSRRRAAKKPVAKNAMKANQLKLQKKAQTENATTMLDKALGLAYSVGVFLQSDNSVISGICEGQTNGSDTTDVEQLAPSGR